MSRAITANHGFIDKFLGDAILAVFDRDKNHGEDAINAAVAMQLRLQEFNGARHKYNLETPVNIGIGIHTGIGLIGTVGSDNRMDSTVIGDVVNTAARLEELTKLYGTPILVSDTTLSHVQENYEQATLEVENNGKLDGNISTTFYPCRWVDRVTPRGKLMVIELYEILGTQTQPLDAAKLRSNSCYNLGIEAWKRQEFTLALGYFQQVLEENPTDTMAKLYLERCQTKLGLTPQQTGSSWDGIATG
jgi:two-component system sensor histidine kinase ChiS